MKLWFRVLLLLLLGLIGNPATARAEPTLFPAKEDSYILPYDFGSVPAGRFSGGVVAAASHHNHLWGYRNQKGQWVIEPRFRYARPFSENRAFVHVGDGWTYVNPEGERITRKAFRWSHNFGNFSEGRAAVRTDNGWGYIDRAGDWVVEPQFDWAAPFQGGMAWVRSDNKKGYINREGNWVLPPEYDDLRSFSDDRAPARKGDRWGFINRDGEWILPRKYQWADPFRGGVARVKKDGEWGYIDRDGRWILPPQDEIVPPFREGVGLLGGKVINSEGDAVFRTSDRLPGFFFNRRSVSVSPEGGWNYRTDTGHRLLDHDRDWADRFSGSRALVESGTDWSFIDRDGALAMNPSLPHKNRSSRAKRKRVRRQGSGQESSSLYRDPGGERYRSPRHECGADPCWSLSPRGETFPLHTVEVTRHPYQIPTPGELRSAIELRLQTFRAARRKGWYDYEEAREDGYHSVSRLDPLKAHHVKESYLADSAVLDPERPENLMYYPTAEGKKLVGAMYVMNSNRAEGPQIGGPLTVWHYHTLETVYCRKYGQLPVRPARNGQCEVGIPDRRGPEMLHVWFVDHPEGPFASPMSLSFDFIQELSDQSIRDRSLESLRRGVIDQVR